MKCGTFMACTRCGTVNWRTDAYLWFCKTARLGCRNCGHDEYRFANRYATFREKLYLTRWYLWETNHMNQRGFPGADPYWYYKPWLLARTVYKGFTIMRQYNIVQSEGDHERPGNIAALRAELSRHHVAGSAPVDGEAHVLPRPRAVSGH